MLLMTTGCISTECGSGSPYLIVRLEADHIDGTKSQSFSCLASTLVLFNYWCWFAHILSVDATQGLGLYCWPEYNWLWWQEMAHSVVILEILGTQNLRLSALLLGVGCFLCPETIDGQIADFSV